MVDETIRSQSQRCLRFFERCFLHKILRDDIKFGKFRADLVAWKISLDVFNSGLASLDQRLREHDELKSIVSGLLTDLEKSLSSCRMSY
jgi:hypothetical protein